MTDVVFDTLLKLIVIGDAGVGKSCILHRFVNNRFQQESHTIGVEFGSKIIEVAGKRVKLQIWDTAGQERFRSVTRGYYRGSAGVILVYDVCSRDSFYHVATWLEDAKTLTGDDIVLLLVGNKTDLSDAREVAYLEAARFAQENGLIFFETSARTGDGVDEVFLKVTRTILTRMASGSITSGETPGAKDSADVAASGNDAAPCSC